MQQNRQQDTAPRVVKDPGEEAAERKHLYLCHLPKSITPWQSIPCLISGDIISSGIIVYRDTREAGKEGKGT